MFAIRGRITAALVSLCLLACGGGGGGGSSEATPALRFTPGTLVASADPGVSTTVSVFARPTFATSSTVYVMVIDARGVIEPTLALSAQGDGSYEATLTTASGLARGHYTGELEVRVCPVANCSQQFAGSPVMLPYDITVGVVPNLTPLSRVAGLVDWETHQGNASHTGHVPLVVDPARISLRWRWNVGANNAPPSPAVLAGDTVYLVSSGSFQASRLIALQEHDASERWSHDFGTVFAVNHPAVSGGAVFAASSGHSDTAMWSFDAATGALRFRTPFSSQWEHYYAPAVVDGQVYTNAGSYGGVQSFDTASGASTWFAGLAQYDQWTPAVDADRVYANVGGTLSVLNRADGSVARSMAVPGYSWAGWSSNAMPVLAGGGQVLVRTDGGFSANSPTAALTLLDSVAGTITWSVTGSFVTDPVIANGVVYVANASPLQVEARSLASGQLLWTWPLADAADTGFTANLVATTSHLFVSTQRSTHAIDLATHASVWRYARPGWKAISANGVMVITTLAPGGGADGGVTAVNLR